MPGVIEQNGKKIEWSDKKVILGEYKKYEV